MGTTDFTVFSWHCRDQILSMFKIFRVVATRPRGGTTKSRGVHGLPRQLYLHGHEVARQFVVAYRGKTVVRVNQPLEGKMARVVVVGAGVNGVGCALALLQLHPECQVTIIAKDVTPNTTGDGAAGLWELYKTGATPDDKLNKWALDTYELFSEWWKKGEAKKRGLTPLHGHVLDSDPDPPSDTWRDIPLTYSILSPKECAQFSPICKSGKSFASFTAEPSRFLPTLLEEVKARGGRLVVRHLLTLEEAATEADLLINCSGVGARDLVPDPSVYPCRGQVMRVRAPWVNRFLCNDAKEASCYIIPNHDTVVLGGTQQDNDWNLEVDPADSRAILSKCTAIMPALKSAEVVQEWVGLRPCRKEGVRLEADELKAGSRTVPVIHNYGHGGSGVTLFWGCSREVARLASNILNRSYRLTSKL